MKKYFLLTCCVLLLFSCEKSEFDNNIVNVEKIENVKHLLLEQDQRVAYSLLNENEKVYIWKNRMDNILKYEKLSFEQEKLILELKDYIKPELFSTYKSKGNITEIQLDKWKTKSENHFSKLEVGKYFVNITPISTSQGPDPDEGPPDDVGGGSNNCNCNQSEDYCLWNQSCASSQCQSSYKGCGLLWNSPCNGSCD